MPRELLCRVMTLYYCLYHNALIYKLHNYDTCGECCGWNLSFCRLNLWRSISRKHLKTDKDRSSDLFPPCGLPTLRAVTIEKARSVMKLTATGIVSDLHRCSLFILGDWCDLKHLNPKVQKYRFLLRYQKKLISLWRIWCSPLSLGVMSEKGIRWKSWADTAAVSSVNVFDYRKSHCP